MPGNCDSAMVKTAGMAVSSKKVWSVVWQMPGIRESHKYLARFASLLARIPHHSRNYFIAMILDLANLPSAQGPEQAEKCFPCKSSLLN